MKRAAESAMRAGAKGIKICCAGRLQGAEIARDEWVIIGSVPLHTCVQILTMLWQKLIQRMAS
jgi:small subunit ribosomal protein S3